VLGNHKIIKIITVSSILPDAEGINSSDVSDRIIKTLFVAVILELV
jgi:hypothetical protein